MAYNEGLDEVPDLITIQEIKDLLKISRTRVYNLLNHPDFPTHAYKIPRGRLFRKDQVLEFVPKWNRIAGKSTGKALNMKGWSYVEDDDEL